jgi:hypothetical protein
MASKSFLLICVVQAVEEVLAAHRPVTVITGVSGERRLGFAAGALLVAAEPLDVAGACAAGVAGFCEDDFEVDAGAEELACPNATAGTAKRVNMMIPIFTDSFFPRG